MTTREQKLRELVERWRLHGSSNECAIKVNEGDVLQVCAAEIAAVLDEEVVVSDEMVDRSVAVVLRNCGETLESIGDISLGWVREVQLEALTAALKEPGQ